MLLVYTRLQILSFTNCSILMVYKYYIYNYYSTAQSLKQQILYNYKNIKIKNWFKSIYTSKLNISIFYTIKLKLVQRN